MDAVNFKTNFIGRDGFVWWIGQIAPEEVWIENFGISTEESPKWVKDIKSVSWDIIHIQQQN